MVSTTLQPTLWRTCRVIANHARLQMFALLVQKPGQTVSAIAAQLHLHLPVASEYLRMLEARGILTVQRKGRWVKYRPCASSESGVSRLVEIIRTAFLRNPHAYDGLYRTATAFTHPRRIEIFRSLKDESQSFGNIQETTDISSRAAQWHLRKLEARGFVHYESGRYHAAQPPDAFGRELARLAVE